MPINAHMLIKMLQSKSEQEMKVLTAQEPDVMHQVRNTLADTRVLLESKSIDESIEFTLWNGFWNDYGIHGPRREQPRDLVCSKVQNRGRLLNINFGQHNIGREFSYAHIGIVIANFQRMVVVVPVTSSGGKQIPKELKDAIIPVKSSDYFQFHNDSWILTHQIRAIDKNRIKKDLGKSIAFTPLMKDIELRVEKLYAPYIAKLHRDEVVDLEGKIDQKDQQILSLTKEIEHLKELLQSQAATTKETVE